MGDSAQLHEFERLARCGSLGDFQSILSVLTTAAEPTRWRACFTASFVLFNVLHTGAFFFVLLGCSGFMVDVRPSTRRTVRYAGYFIFAGGREL